MSKMSFVNNDTLLFNFISVSNTLFQTFEYNSAILTPVQLFFMYLNTLNNPF